ncbi:Beta-ketoacyl-acyl-carrier-protein synthase I [Rothia dentocariosa]|uniref:Beta-ketoacyl-acyl-carrier-protein synthase I n=1 Tax=Rothia dentocariosa TaxID=2047 RepID=A0A448UYB1_9MICC|nr:Beta-ketoacyl-acyl-carrier-protein synthase I [Rothia dentocariosa]
MKTVAIMSALEDAQRRKMPSFEVPIHGTTLPFALMEVPRLEFDESAPENAHQVLVRMEAFSCNYRDASILFTSYGVLRTLEKPGFMHFGSDFVGVVEAIGSEVTTVKPGQRVMPDSSYPQDRDPVVGDGIPSNKVGRGWLVFPESKLCPVPDGLDTVEAASLGINAQTAASMLRRAGVKAGSRILITAGKSNTSLCVAGLAAAIGAECTVLSTSPWTEEELDAVRHPTIVSVDKSSKPFSSEPLESLAARNESYDAIIDPFFDLYFMRVMRHLAHGGTYVTCGFKNQHPAQSDASDQGAQMPVSYLYEVLISAVLGNKTVVGNCIGLRNDLEAALEAVAAGKFHPVIDSVYSPDQAEEFLRRSFGAEPRFGKVVMDMRGGLHE